MYINVVVILNVLLLLSDSSEVDDETPMMAVDVSTLTNAPAPTTENFQIVVEDPQDDYDIAPSSIIDDTYASVNVTQSDHHHYSSFNEAENITAEHYVDCNITQ